MRYVRPVFKVELLPRNLEACRRDLDHANVKVRLSSVRDLARVSENEDRTERILLLQRALGDESAEVRREALVALADLKAAEARDRVLSLLRDPEIKVRQMAVMCLGEIAKEGDEEVAGRLASLLRAGDPSIRYQALIAHGRVKPADASLDLLPALRDEDAEIRELSVRLVDEVLLAGGNGISSQLKEALVHAATEDENARVRLVAELLCAELGLVAPREMICLVIARRFRVREPRDEQRAVALAGRLELTDAAEDLRRRAFGRLGFSLDPFRWVALASLCRWGDKRAFEKLKAALGDRSPVDRMMALESLGDSGHPAALSLLRARSDNPGNLDPEVLAEALSNLEAELQAGSIPN